MIGGTCTICGLPGHRYGTTDPEHAVDPVACVNSLRGENERLRRLMKAWQGLAEGRETNYTALLNALRQASDNVARQPEPMSDEEHHRFRLAVGDEEDVYDSDNHPLETGLDPAENTGRP